MNIIHHTYLKLEVPEEHYLSKMERYEISLRLELPLKGTDLGLQKLYKIEHLTFTKQQWNSILNKASYRARQSLLQDMEGQGIRTSVSLCS